MFEYLMPPLLLGSYPGTLLYQTAEAAIDQQIDTRDLAKVDAVKDNVDRPLPIDLISHRHQTAREQSFINAFQQSRPEFAVKAHGNANHIMRNLVNGPGCHLCDLCASARIL